MGRMAARVRYYPPFGQAGRQTSFSPTTGTLSKALSGITLSSAGSVAEVGWTTVPTINFTQGIAETRDLTAYTTNFNSSLHQFQLLTGTLPTGVTLNPSVGYVYDGTSPISTASGISIRIVDTAAADWVARSTATGVVYASRLDTALSLNNSTILPGANTTNINTQASHFSLDTTYKPSGSTASQRITCLNTDGADSGTIRCYFGATQTFGNGSTMWFSFRVRYTEQYAWQFWQPTETRGPKLAIMSHYGSSNQVNEIVPDLRNLNQIDCYWQDGNSTAVVSDVAYSSAGNSSDVRSQPPLDRGANLLTGTNPDTGAAWTTWQQQRAQYGHLYSAYSSPGSAETRLGLGDPFSGAVRMVPGEWMTITVRVIIGTFGLFNNRLTVWAARENQAYQKTVDAVNIRLGAGSPDYNTLWLLPYVSNRVAGGRQIGSRTSNITGIDLYTVGPSAPIGAGTLSWNATTQRLTWAGNGETAGTAVGFSSSNGILVRNVCSGTSTNSFVVAKLTGTPPVTNQTDTVTIVDGRPDTFVNYADVIVSSQPINAPGGYVPS
jgi:hypothetical protein